LLSPLATAGRSFIEIVKSEDLATNTGHQLSGRDYQAVASTTRHHFPCDPS
jgi:hypothetical protein